MLPSAVLPEILQSDIGKEFLGYCIKMIRIPYNQSGEG
jgi:hypothetical protein